jgi:hypothetical protein
VTRTDAISLTVQSSAFLGVRVVTVSDEYGDVTILRLAAKGIELKVMRRRGALATNSDLLRQAVQGLGMKSIGPVSFGLSRKPAPRLRLSQSDFMPPKGSLTHRKRLGTSARSL